MKIIAFIPIRGGSKRIPLKNIKEINGKPLAWWVIDAACESNHIDEVIVATDSGKIISGLGSIANPKIKVITVQHMGHKCLQETVMLDYAEQNQFDYIVLLQATSPLTTAKDLDEAILKCVHDECNSLISVCRQKRFIWRTVKGFAKSITYSPRKRPREQDWDGLIIENGCFFITSREGLINSGCRISGKVGLHEMHEDTYFQLDTPQDWWIVEKLLKKRN